MGDIFGKSEIVASTIGSLIKFNVLFKIKAYLCKLGCELYSYSLIHNGLIIIILYLIRDSFDFIYIYNLNENPNLRFSFKSVVRMKTTEGQFCLFPPTREQTFGTIWRHFQFLPLRERGCYRHLVCSSAECC